MSENSKIEWCHHTFNPWWGCTAVSEGCRNCYAETWAKRFGVKWGNNAPRRLSSEKVWVQPHRWNRQAFDRGTRYRVFCASMADVFDERVPDEWRERLWQLIWATETLDWLILTKRPGNAIRAFEFAPGVRPFREIPKNIWLGVSVEDQKTADERIPILLQIPVAVRFLSCEPLLGPIDLRNVNGGTLNCLDGIDFEAIGDIRDAGDWSVSDAQQPPPIDWVIVGGESGRDARPMDLAWARDIVAQCKSADVPVFVKQLGARIVGDASEFRTIHRLFYPNDGYGFVAFRLCDSKGGDPNEWPEDLRIREFPTVGVARA